MHHLSDFNVEYYSVMFVYENTLVKISVIGKKDMEKEDIVELVQIIIDKM
ncbi:MAG: hypothetical protein KKB31_01750 [Nanoarchaeota archaeon]|nr:hypothetical protein [Nanoarchaeota archaeon]